MDNGFCICRGSKFVYALTKVPLIVAWLVGSAQPLGETDLEVVDGVGVEPAVGEVQDNPHSLVLHTYSEAVEQVAEKLGQ